MKLGICLSGGGIKGLSYIGALRVLEENNIVPDMMAGCSVGSIIAGLYSYGLKSDEIEKLLYKNIKGLIDINYKGILKAISELILRKKPSLSGLVKGEKLDKLLSEVTKGSKINQAGIPLAIIATNINNAYKVLFSSEKLPTAEYDITYVYDAYLSDAIRASIAVPGVFSPKKFGDMTLIDGGVKNTLPFSYLLNMGADKVLAFNLSYNGQNKQGITNLMDIAYQALDIFGYNIVEVEKDKYKIVEMNYKNADISTSANKQILMLNPSISGVSLLDIKKVGEVIEKGYEFTQGYIDVIKDFLKT